MTLPRLSLRLLLVAVGVLCAWLAWERSVVMERRAAKAYLENAGAYVGRRPVERDSNGKGPGMVRRLMGDEDVALVGFDGNEWTGDDVQLVFRVFPEATLRW